MVTVGILALLLIFAACGGTNDTTTSTGTGATSGAGAQVVMRNTAFDPDSLTINAGETVTWTNEDSAAHTVVGDNGEFESAELANGDTFSFMFDQAGTYTYHCSIHPSMKGTVVVQ